MNKSYDELYENLESALSEFWRLMEIQEYFEAHEVLESAWHPLRRRQAECRNIVKGLINAAIALEHLRREKKKSARVAKKAFNAYLRYKNELDPEGEFPGPLLYRYCKKVDDLCSHFPLLAE